MHKLFNELVGKAMWACRRGADMATFQFGERRRVNDFYGRDTEVGEYALHVQCPWRIVRDDVVAVGSGDLYYPASYSVGDRIPEDFDWEQNANRRDTLIENFFERGNQKFTVSSVELGVGGRCRIDFAEGPYLEIFPDDSLTHEHWRLFSTSTQSLVP